MTPEELRALDQRVAELRGDCPSGEPECYSTDPRASRVLLDEMAAHSSLVASYGEWRDPEGWMVTSWPVPGRAGKTARAASLDAAICLAWCAWKEAQA